MNDFLRKNYSFAILRKVRGFNNKFFYEERPYIYAIIGVAALLFSKHSRIALISGLVLIVCAALILFLRKMHRSKLGELKKKHDQFTNQKKKDSIKFEL